MQAELIRAAMIMIADKHDDASEGCRHGLAAVIEDLASRLDDDYLRGLADGLRIKSRSRRVKETPCH